MATHIAMTTPKARQEHQCDLCFEAINPGAVYVRQTMAQDDGLYTFKAHERCQNLMTAWIGVYDYNSEGCPSGSYAQVVEDLCDHYGCDLAGLYGITILRDET